MQSDRCNTCRWYAGGLVCKAFLDGIPDDILTGINPHTELMPEQDSPVVWEPVPDGGTDIMDLIQTA